MNFTLKQAEISVRGQTVIVREMSAGARAEMLEAAKVSQFRAQIVMAQHCACDAQGKPLFDAKDFEKAAAWPPDVIDAVANKAMELSGVGEGSQAPKG